MNQKIEKGVDKSQSLYYNKYIRQKGGNDYDSRIYRKVWKCFSKDLQ